MSLKYTIIIISISLLLFGCKCDNYFSNSSQKSINEKYFSIECHIVPTVVQTQNDEIEITFNYKSVPFEKVIKSTFKVIPIIYETGDTLNFLSEYASVYKFEAKKELKSKLNLELQFKVDSAGIVISKDLVFKRLNKVSNCRFRPVLH